MLRSLLVPVLLAVLAPLPVAAAVTAPFDTALHDIERDAAGHKHPVAVFDLDDTLFATAPRTFHILLDWLDSPEGKAYAASREKLEHMELGYDLDPTLVAIGIPQAGMKSAEKWWVKRFFSSDYLKYDTPNPGAVPFTNKIFKDGATVVYLTGRNKEMRPGTEEALKHYGFPWSPKDGRTMLVTKTVFRQKDDEFKFAAVQDVEKKVGPVELAVDNEPRNVNAMHDACPRAIAVWLDKPHSANPPALESGVFTAKDFPAN